MQYGTEGTKATPAISQLADFIRREIQLKRLVVPTMDSKGNR